MAEQQFSDFIVLLARQRSGTHALRSILEEHPDIFGVEEPFHLKTAEVPNPNTEDTNFFSFLKRYANGDPLKLIPTDYGPVFLDYLRHLRSLTNRRYLLLDVKLNSAHHIQRAFQPLLAPPYLFDLILKHGLRTFFLTRKNYLRYYLSITKANSSALYHVDASQQEPQDTKLKVNIYEMRLELKRCLAEDAFVDDCFTEYADYWGYPYADKYLIADYADIFRDRDGATADFLARFSQWLGLPNSFPASTKFQKQSHLPLKQAIENYDEVVKALRGTPFSYCLKDENVSRAGAPKPGSLLRFLSGSAFRSKR